MQKNRKTQLSDVQQLSGKIDQSKIMNMLATNKKIGSMADLHKAYRKQQLFKNKLKTTLEKNQILDQKIKAFEIQIRDLRTVITFQMKELTKHMAQKLKQFTDDKLQTSAFYNEKIAHESVKQMMNKYQQIQKQSKMVKKSQTALKNIQQAYRKHATQMRSLLIQSQRNDRQYRQKMNNLISQKDQQIQNKRTQCMKTASNTKQAIEFIQWFQQEKLKLKKDQLQLKNKLENDINNLNKKAQQTDQMMKMTQIVIDQSNRQQMYEKMLKKTEQLKMLQKNNDKLQVQLRELDLENKVWQKVSKKHEKIGKAYSTSLGSTFYT